MKNKILIKMLDMLTGAYTRTDLQRAQQELKPVTNIGKLFSIFAYGFDMVREHIEKIRLWDNLDYAQGKVLDRYGANFGVTRDGTSDAFYRLLIKVKMISQLSGGDIDTVINAVATMYSIDPLQVKFEEIFPAKIRVTIQAADLGKEQLDAIDIISKLIKRIIAAGVGFYTMIETKVTYSCTKLRATAFSSAVLQGRIGEKSVVGTDYPVGTKLVPLSVANIVYTVAERNEEST